MAYKDPEIKKAYQKEYYRRNRAKLKADAAARYVANSEQVKLSLRENYRNDPEKFKDRVVDWRMRNQQKHRETRKRWEAKNAHEIREYQNAYRRSKDKERRETDHGFVILERLRARLRGILRACGGRKVNRTINLIGCSQQELVSHIENQFVDGMSWTNRHLWHIDHIRPCSSYDMRDPDQQKLCFNYTNLQPLWARDNIIKRDKI